MFAYLPTCCHEIPSPNVTDWTEDKDATFPGNGVDAQGLVPRDFLVKTLSNNNSEACTPLPVSCVSQVSIQTQTTQFKTISNETNRRLDRSDK